MSKLILLIVGAAWMAVLLPPLLRGRMESGPISSVSAFRQQLHTLQRSHSPMRGQAPMRAMARPLAPSTPVRQLPTRDPRVATGRPRLVSDAAMFDATPSRPRRSHHRVVSRPSAHATRSHHAAGPALMSPAEMVRRRRTNVLYALLGLNATSLFLAFSTGSSMMTFVFAVAALALVGYCYMLVQMRNQARLRQYYAYYGRHRAA